MSVDSNNLVPQQNAQQIIQDTTMQVLTGLYDYCTHQDTIK